MESRFLVFAFFAQGLLGAQPSAIWLPPPRPAICSTFTVELGLMDISKSMAKAGRIEAARRALVEAIDASPPCRLMIIGTFGVTADVRAAEFLTDASARSRLKAAAMAFRPVAAATNLDEAAKAVELLTYQLKDAYGKDFGVLIVTAYTDNMPSPSPGKPLFSLAGYLAARLRAVHVRVSGETATIGVSTTADERPAETRTEGRLRASIVRPFLLFLLPALALALGAWAFLRRRRVPPGPGDEIVGLLVTEVEEGEAPAGPRVLSRDIRVAAAAGLPVPFSADPNRGAYVVAPGGEVSGAGEIFCVFPQNNGEMLIEGAAGVTVAGQPLPARGAKINAADGVVIGYRKRSFQIRPVFAGILEQVPAARRTA